MIVLYNIYLDNPLHLNDVFFAKLPEAYAIFDPIVDVIFMGRGQSYQCFFFF